MELVTPNVNLRDSYLRALRDYQDEGSRTYINVQEISEDFERYVEQLIAQADLEITRNPGIVPQTTLWLASGREYLGHVGIRHWLTDKLRYEGGHIGYTIAPAARRQGHATRMLGLALPVANKLGINPAMLTCDVGNTASRKVIEANGGVLDEEFDGKLRFWVSTSPA